MQVRHILAFMRKKTASKQIFDTKSVELLRVNLALLPRVTRDYNVVMKEVIRNWQCGYDTRKVSKCV